MKKIDSEMMTRIEQLCTDEGVTLDQLEHRLNELKDRKEYKRILERIEDNKELVGRCFKGHSSDAIGLKNGLRPLFGKDGVFYETVFYKVVSERADRIYDVECITFPQNPEIRFEAERHKKWQPTDGIVGHYFYNGICCQSVNKHTIKGLTEISEEEFEEAAKHHLDLLLKTDWQTIATPFRIRRFSDEAR